MRSLFTVPSAFLLCISALAADPTRVLPEGETPKDIRLGKAKTLDDRNFFFKPPTNIQSWELRRRELREQVLVANGLWPMPEKTPLNPVIHGKIDRDDYTIEKVYFASRPGHYVTGNLYRPKGKTGKLPAVLFAHGHWNDGRMHDAGEREAKSQMTQKGEQTMNSARYPLQAPCAMLARMGCVVFTYDMVGYADSLAITHRVGFTDAEADLRLQSFMGMQTWNSVRALDFVTSLPDVDDKRIGMTGASGGGSQTFVLCGIDPRPAVAFPAVMVSTAMQGGCVCENCDYLRVGTGNVELAGLFAPKPMAMSGANDWTLEIETKGFPELKALYKLYGAEDKVLAKCWPQFGHNYNQVSREFMYGWFNKYLGLGLTEPIHEKPFEPVRPKELSVFDAEHPKPSDFLDAERLRKVMAEASDKQIQALIPKKGKESLTPYRYIIGTALRVMVNDTLPTLAEVESKRVGEPAELEGYKINHWLLARKGSGEQVPALTLQGKQFDGRVVVWIHPDGKAGLFKDGKLIPEAKKILDSNAAIVAIDVLGTGELKLDKIVVNNAYAGFTFGYNRSLCANRVHDILTAVAFARGLENAKTIDLLGEGKAGPWVLLARGLCGDAIKRTAADMDEFRFEKVRTTNDEMMLPGALKYGGLPALMALAAPAELFVHNHRGTGTGQWLKPVYEAAGAIDKLKQEPLKESTAKVVEWLLR